ncbi:unnamed protein product [Darwinula stevensoni]|uniref:Uncharacterized protein n=1 Tax=Darwinula stevensoni TaxID=69355 RepID=A0A7R9A741_9CRUS|nr:unnamed protein product [Darwinula stevensoni]CAG0890157.1 unnamed protein product [Darwinula stevensoni]
MSSAFIRKLTTRMKVQRHRQKHPKRCLPNKEVAASTKVDIPEISVEDALRELAEMTRTMQAGLPFDHQHVDILLSLTFNSRKSIPIDVLQPFMCHKTVLSGEVARWLHSASFSTLLKKLTDALDKFANAFQEKAAILSVQEFLSRRSVMSRLILKDDCSNRAAKKLLGPHCLLHLDQSVQFTFSATSQVTVKDVSPEEGAIICLGFYFMRDISYPAAYGQLLGFLQSVLLNDSFSHNLQSVKLRNLLEKVCYKSAGVV